MSVPLSLTTSSRYGRGFSVSFILCLTTEVSGQHPRNMLIGTKYHKRNEV